MNGAGVHTFKMINKAGKETLVKFHWISKQGTFSCHVTVCQHDRSLQWCHSEQRLNGWVMLAQVR